MLDEARGNWMELDKRNEKWGGKGRNKKFGTKLHIFTSWFELNIENGRMLGLNWMKIEV